jgi:hypothetical protein
VKNLNASAIVLPIRIELVAMVGAVKFYVKLNLRYLEIFNLYPG